MLDFSVDPGLGLGEFKLGKFIFTHLNTLYLLFTIKAWL